MNVTQSLEGEDWHSSGCQKFWRKLLKNRQDNWKWYVSPKISSLKPGNIVKVFPPNAGLSPPKKR
ncbi:MAG TPA: hypothetical protein DD706_10070 [Nitrospiraceae bacterium]|nr:hypothetical protein [Nitrospiraceae bacterium]